MTAARLSAWTLVPAPQSHHNVLVNDAKLASRRDVVACVVTDGHRICLVRRSRHVSHDQGLWHCVTGYVDHGAEPTTAALRELSEELGLVADGIDSLHRGNVLRYVHDGVLWVVHTLLVRTRQRRFELNWENDVYAWVPYGSTPQSYVWWLADVCRSVAGGTTPTAPRNWLICIPF